MVQSRIAVLIGSVFILSVVSLSFASEGHYTRAIVESCKGCQLNRLPDVKKFIFEDIPEYKNVEFKHIQGAPPHLLLYNENEQEIERLPLAQLTREECNDLLVSKGFKRSIAAVKDEI